MRLAVALSLVALLTAPSIAQGAGPEGLWRDRFGTTVRFSFCGTGSQLCAVLLDIGGSSRTAENLKLLNRRVIKANKTAPNRWAGTVSLNGLEADGTITQVAPDTIEITGCKAVVLCQTIPFKRVKRSAR